MSKKRLITFAVMALAAAMPASAYAGAGPGDDIDDAILPPNDVLPVSTARNPHVLGYDVNTARYTTQPNENLFCPISRTGNAKTVWGAFRAPRYGRLAVTTAGFDSVISLYDINRRNGNLRETDCTDRLAGTIESFPTDGLPTVARNHIYAVQVGGAVQNNGSVPGGPLEVNLELIPPDTVVGDAELSWQGYGKGVKIRSLRVAGERGSTILVFCVKKSCSRKPVRIRGRKLVARRLGRTSGFGRSVARRMRSAQESDSGSALMKPIGDLDVGGRSLAKARARTAAAQRRVAHLHAARFRTIFKGRKVKNGDTLVVAVQARNQIGEIFIWRVRGGIAKTKQIGCIEPSSTKIRALGTCTGR